MSITRRLRRITHLRAALIRAPVPVPGPTNTTSPGLTSSPRQRLGILTRRLGRRVFPSGEIQMIETISKTVIWRLTLG
jgi:hypothetical protein